MNNQQDSEEAKILKVLLSKGEAALLRGLPFGEMDPKGELQLGDYIGLPQFHHKEPGADPSIGSTADKS